MPTAETTVEPMSPEMAAEILSKYEAIQAAFDNQLAIARHLVKLLERSAQ